jgi:hypothetical protein
MKNIPVLPLLAAAFVLGANALLQAADQFAITENIEPLKMFLGNWSVSYTDQNGQTITGSATVKPEAGGNIVTLRNEFLNKSGTAFFSRVSIFYWQAESGSIAEVNFDSNGWHGTNVLASHTGDKMVWQGKGYSAEGKTGVEITETTQMDANTWTAQFIHQTYDGKPMTDSPKFKFTRIK